MAGPDQIPVFKKAAPTIAPYLYLIFFSHFLSIAWGNASICRFSECVCACVCHETCWLMGLINKVDMVCLSPVGYGV